MSWLPKEWIASQAGGGSVTAQAIEAALGFVPCPNSHVHSAISDVSGLQAALDAKQASGSYAAQVHGHAIADVTGLQTALDGKQAAGSYAAATHNHDAAYAAAGHTHANATTSVAGLMSAADKTKLDGLGGGGLPSLYRLTAAHSNNTVTPSTIGNAGGNTPWTHTLVAGKTYRFTVSATHQTAAATTGGRMNLLGARGAGGNGCRDDVGRDRPGGGCNNA